MSKSIFASKTFWLNVLGPVFAWLATEYGFALTPKEQLEVIGIGMSAANVVMRFLTKTPVHVGARPPAVIALCALGLSLAGCAGAVPWNDQNDVGIAKLHLQFEPMRDATGNVIGSTLTDAFYINGKEGEAVKLAADIGKGTISYEAGKIAAFDGQKLRAAVEMAVSQNVADVTPSVVAAIIQAVMKAFVPVP